MNPSLNKYSFELWTPDGTLLADLSSGLALNRSIIQSRNKAEDISWEMNLDSFEAYCRMIGVKSSNLLISGVTEVRVKRGKKYLCGGQIVYAKTSIKGDDRIISVKAKGFLQMLNKRRTGTTDLGAVQEVFTNTSRADMLWALINQSQALPNGNFGITRGTIQHIGTGYDKTYARTIIKDAIENATQYLAGAIDFEFTHDKQFNTYKQIGSTREDIVFEYPGNILSVEIPDDTTDLTNQIIAVGQGLDSDTQVVVTPVDTNSAANYKLRQDTLISNATNNADGGLDRAANAELEASKLPYEIPSLTVDGNSAPYVTDYGIGDFIICKLNGSDLINHINGLYRLERRTIDIDNNDNELVTLEVDA